MDSRAALASARPDPRALDEDRLGGREQRGVVVVAQISQSLFDLAEGALED